MAFDLRLYLSTNDFQGSYTKFTYKTDMDHEDGDDKRNYKIFVAERSNLATLVEVDNGASVRLILVEKKNSTTLELSLALTHNSLGFIKWTGKSVESCLVNAVEIHDQAWPEHNECLFKFTVGATNIEEIQWKQSMRSAFEAAGVGKEPTHPDEARNKPKVGQSKAGKSKAAISKPSKTTKAATKKPAKK